MFVGVGTLVNVVAILIGASIESAAGVGEGARTGLASVVTGACFLLTTFLAPLVAIIPYEAATPALVIVGFLMMTQIKGIDWEDYGIAIPAFLTIILMPFTYNISVGIGAGFVTHVVIRYMQGRRKDVHPLLLLNRVLTTVVGESGSHTDIGWKKITVQLECTSKEARTFITNFHWKFKYRRHVL